MAEDNVSGRVSGSSMAKTPVSSSDSDITNKDVYEFFKTHKGSENSRSITDRFLNHFGVNTSANPTTLYKKIKSLYDTCTKKLKTASKRTEFLSRKFHMPLSRIEWTTSQDTSRKRVLKEKLRENKEERKALKREFLSFKGEKLSIDERLEDQIDRYTTILGELANALNQFHKDISNLHEVQSTLQGKLDEIERSYQAKTRLLFYSPSFH